jgi:tRNA pseudouridine55 synthase
MEGKPLYEYARNGVPLPRPIEPRKINVLSIELVDWQDAAPRIGLSELPEDPPSAPPQGHRYSWPKAKLDAEQVVALEVVRKLISEASPGLSKVSVDPDQPENGAADVSSPATSSLSCAVPSHNIEEPKIPPVFTLKMTVSSGTYVRSIVHDLAHAVGSSAHVVSLARTRQGEFAVGPKYSMTQPCFEGVMSKAEAATSVGVASVAGLEDEVAGDCIPWEVFEKAIKLRNEQPEYEVPTGEREDWEEILLTRIHAV